jgi:phosphoribosyl 1,2-cyclic phosphodiesterase
MRLKLWGVRGSIPASAPAMSGFGCNTPCLSVSFGKDNTLILDCGTGLFRLGKELAGKKGDIFVLFSHLHWDHLQGLPFFDPLYEKGRKIYFLSGFGALLESSLKLLMDRTHFPVDFSKVGAETKIVEENEIDFLLAHGLRVSRIANNHPGGCFAYRLFSESGSAVYCTDNELRAPKAHHFSDFEDFVEFSRDANVLIHDAQYLDGEMERKRGWGHSSIDQARELAAKAKVGRVVYFHHDPERSDAQLEKIERDSRAWFAERKLDVKSDMAREGMEIEF